MTCETSLREDAQNYVERGFAICRLAPGEKQPRYSEWQLSSLSPEKFREADNIGIIAGTLSGDLVCVDLDHPEAVRLADTFLPETGMVEGRPGKPRSHRWYRVTDIPDDMTSPTQRGGPWHKHFRHGETRENLIDFIGTGGQAAVPPSLHSSGERRTWDQFEEPACVPMRELWEAVNRLAEACGYKPKEKPIPKPKKERPKGEMGAKDTSQLLPLLDRIEMGRKFIEKADLAVAGCGGHDATFRVARYLRNDLALPDEIGRELLDRYNQRLAEAGEEQWTDAALQHKWETADGPNPDYPFGCKVTVKAHEPVNDPHRLAREFLAAARWVCWNGFYYKYEGTHYRAIPDQELRASLTAHIKNRFDADFAEKDRQYRDAVSDGDRQTAARKPSVLSVKSGLVQNVLQALEGYITVPSTKGLPSWLNEESPGEWIALKNGLLNLTNGDIRAHTSEWFSAVCLPYEFDPRGECPKWLAVLFQNLEGDTDRVSILQEFFGYCLVKTTDAQSYLWLVGDGGNGKSVVLAALHAVLGPENVSTVPLEDLGARFALAQTLGKLVNISPEVGILNETQEGKLKSFTSGDPMTFERKGTDTFTARPTARLVVSSNALPAFLCRTEAHWRRLILMPFNRRVPDDERVFGMDKPEWWLRAGEVPGILNWALEGLRRLRANGMVFSKSPACQAAKETHRRDSDPSREFLEEHYILSPNATSIPVDNLYHQYQAWCAKVGVKAETQNKFGRHVRSVFGIESSTHRAQGRVERAWFGLARRSADVTHCNGFIEMRNTPTVEGGRGYDSVTDVTHFLTSGLRNESTENLGMKAEKSVTSVTTHEMQQKPK